MKPYYKNDGVTIYLGDCRDILPDLPSADLILTDPPYEMKEPPFGAMASRLSRRGSIYCFGDVDIIASRWFQNFPMDQKTLLIWYYKNSPKPKGRWRMAMQGIIYGHRSDAPFYEDAARVEYTPAAKNLNGRQRPSPGRLSRRGYYDTSKGALPRSVIEWPALTGHLSRERVGHPDQKPLGLMRQLVMTVAPKSIIDPFLGSGTSLVAAKQLGIPVIGIEIEKKYVHIAIRRLEAERKRA